MDHSALLGPPNAYGEYCSFPCPRCGETRTHATPALNLWRCWACDFWGALHQLLRLPRRPASAQPSGRAELPRRRVVSLEVVER